MHPNYTPNDVAIDNERRTGFTFRSSEHAKAITTLEGLLVEQDKTKVLEGLTGLIINGKKLILEEGFAGKGLTEIRIAIRAIIDQLRAYDGVEEVGRDIPNRQTVTADAVEKTTATELSPERQGTLTTILARFDANEHNIACHTPDNKAKLEAKLRAKPEKLDGLKDMEESGGAPDVTKVDSGDFVFNDTVKSFPAGSKRRNLDYADAESMAKGMGNGKAGVTLLDPKDYLELGNDMGIVMGEDADWVWLLTNEETIKWFIKWSKDTYGIDVSVGDVLCGDRNIGGVGVGQGVAKVRTPNGAFRCSLRV